jgi:hypothetical protein
MKIDPRIPVPVQPIIKDYLRLTEHQLVGLVYASYIIGSIALGELNDYSSEIDFITVLSRRASPIDLGHLRNIYQFIEKTYPRWKMSGSYVQASDLGKLGKDSSYRFRFGRMVQTVRFRTYVIDTCNGHFVS